MTGLTFRHREQDWTILNQVSAHKDIAEFLRDRIGTSRVTYDRQELPYNFGDWYGIDDANGYISPLTNAFRLGTMHNGALFSARYRISRTPRFEGQQLAFQGNAGMNVYTEPDALPRAWSAHQAASMTTAAELYQFLQRPVGELRNIPPFTGTAPAVESCPEPDSVRIESMTPTRIRIAATMRCAGVVILSNAHASGWQATVDGRDERIYAPYGFLQGVRVEAGHHSVEFRYVPLTLYIGSALAVAGLLALLMVGRLTAW